MEEIKNAFDGKMEKTVLKLFFPGLLATWSLWIALLKYISSQPIWKELSKENELLKIVLLLTIFIVIYGIGHLIMKLALRVEVELMDKWYEKKIAKGEFETVWNNYLKTSFESEKLPVIIRYYSSFIISYHFELACMVAIAIQLILVHLVDIHYTHLLSAFGVGLITIISIAAIVYLFWEARKAVEVAHQLRQQIIEAFNNNKG